MNRSEIEELVKEMIMKRPRYWPVKHGHNKVKLAHPEQLSNVNILFNTSSGIIRIGEGTFAGHDVSLITGTHPTGKTMGARAKQFPKSGCDIIIGKGVWLGSSCTVLGPCTIGDHSVIAAGAVVTPNTIIGESELWGGVPAKLIKNLPHD